MRARTSQWCPRLFPACDKASRGGSRAASRRGRQTGPPAARRCVSPPPDRARNRTRPPRRRRLVFSARGPSLRLGAGGEEFLEPLFELLGSEPLAVVQAADEVVNDGLGLLLPPVFEETVGE